MTPDFWKANLFLTDNNGGGTNDTLKASVAELKALLTTSGDGGAVESRCMPHLDS
jgi:hypothetical protein